MKKILIALLFSLISSASLAQSFPSNPAMSFKMVPTVGQWNNWFAQKQNVLGYTPVNRAGDVLSGRIVTASPGVNTAGLNMTCGTAPLAPINGDMWCTSSGMFVRINGTTVGPLVSANGSGPLTITASNANALTVGPNGVTNPTFNINSSAGSAVTGVNIIGGALASGVAMTATSSGSNEAFSIDAKGTGALKLGSVSTGGVTVGVPTGGGEGTGTLNVAGSIFNNGTGPTGTGGYVRATNPTIAGMTLTLGSDATGDIFYRNSGGVVTRLAVGTNGNVLTVSSGLPSWQAGTTAASVASGTTTVTSATNGNCLYNAAGTLQNRPCLTAPQGRLTLQANTPVMRTTQSAQSILRYDCFNGSQVPYFDGTGDQLDTITSCEVTATMVSAASAGQTVSNNLYDVWWVHSGANRICLAMSASAGGGGGWSSDASGSNTARGTGFSQLDLTTRGYITNKNAIANCFNGATNYGSVTANQGTYLGTIFTTANGQTGWVLGGRGSTGILGVYNAYNRVPVTVNVADSATSWTYTGAVGTWRQANANGNNQIQSVDGLGQMFIVAQYADNILTGSGGASQVALGIDSTTTATGRIGFAPLSINIDASSTWRGSPGIGLHTVVALEQGNGVNNATYFGSVDAQHIFMQLEATHEGM